MLGRNTATVLLHHLEHPLRYFAAFLSEFLDRECFGFEYIQVYIAVANMAKPDNLEIGISLADERIDFFQKYCNFRYFYRNVILVGSESRNSLGNILTQPP